MCVCVHACACTRVCACVCVHVCVCVVVVVGCGEGKALEVTLRGSGRERAHRTPKKKGEKKTEGETQHSVRSPLAQTKRVQMYK